jgi:hypothetical protein
MASTEMNVAPQLTRGIMRPRKHYERPMSFPLDFYECGRCGTFVPKLEACGCDIAVATEAMKQEKDRP